MLILAGRSFLIFYSYKIQLCPNSYQEKRLFFYAHTARFSYNWALEWLFYHHNDHHQILGDGELRKLFTQYKNLPGNEWLYTVSNNVPKQAIKEACADFANYIFHSGPKPSFKQRTRTTPSFYQDGEKIFFTTTHVKLERIGSKSDGTFHQNLILLAEPHRIPTNCKYENPNIYFDGFKWWLTVSIKYPDIPRTYTTLNLPSKHKHPLLVAPASYGLGIDLGLINYATLSDGTTYSGINKSPKVISLEKRKKRLYKSLLRKYKNADIPLLLYHYDKYSLTSSVRHHNIIKNEREWLKLQKRLHNTRVNYINHIIKDILLKRPLFIVIEGLALKKLMEEEKLYYAVKNQYFNYFRKKLAQKCKELHIPLYVADRYFPSTQKCCVCGKLNKLTDLSVRTYHCSCGNIIDRDLQAAINLRNHMYEHASSEFKPTDCT